MGVDPPQSQDQDDHKGTEEDEYLPAGGEAHGDGQLMPGIPEGVPQDRHRDDRPDEGQPVNMLLQLMCFCHRYPLINLVYICFYENLILGVNVDQINPNGMLGVSSRKIFFLLYLLD